MWLRTKPFSAPPNEELPRCLHTFAHIVQLMQLGLRSQVLDVGCGPGWLSEFLARYARRDENAPSSSAREATAC